MSILWRKKGNIWFFDCKIQKRYQVANCRSRNLHFSTTKETKTKGEQADLNINLPHCRINNSTLKPSRASRRGLRARWSSYDQHNARTFIYKLQSVHTLSCSHPNSPKIHTVTCKATVCATVTLFFFFLESDLFPQSGHMRHRNG